MLPEKRKTNTYHCCFLTFDLSLIQFNGIFKTGAFFDKGEWNGMKWNSINVAGLKISLSVSQTVLYENENSSGPIKKSYLDVILRINFVIIVIYIIWYKLNYYETAIIFIYSPINRENCRELHFYLYTQTIGRLNLTLLVNHVALKIIFVSSNAHTSRCFSYNH